jgi:putative toxin-antitoxin system antitoxin component (TIGR02293 family)
VRYLREGLPVSAWDALKRLLRCSDRELGILTQIPPSTLARRRRAGRLNRLEGERLYRVAAVVAQALSTFGDPEAAVGWLRQPNLALGGRVPLEYADTPAGARAVVNLLGGLEHGVVQ